MTKFFQNLHQAFDKQDTNQKQYIQLEISKQNSGHG